MRLMLDEDSQRHKLIHLLRQQSHDVLTVYEANLTSSDDKIVLARAQSERRIVLTRNGKDFKKLHEKTQSHYGILVIHEFKDVSKNMEPADIARAIDNIEASGWDITGEFVSLNSWNFSQA